MTANLPLDRSIVIEHTLEALTRMSPVPRAQLDSGTHIFAQAGLDSTSALELLMILEDELGVRVDPDSLTHDHLETVGSLADYFLDQAGTPS